MLLRNLRIFQGIRYISTSIPKCMAADVIRVSNKETYYKTMGNQDDTTIKPEGWDEALPYNDIPGPKPTPVLGNTWRFLAYIGEFSKIPRHELDKILHQRYGNLVALRRILGQKEILLTYNADDIEKFMRNEGVWPIRSLFPSLDYYREYVRNDVFKGVNGLVSSQGEDWFKIRSAVNPILMQPRTARHYVGSMDQVANDLVRNMAHFAKRNENNEMPEDFLNELFKWTLESTGVIAFNKRLGCLDLDLAADSEAQKYISQVNELFDAFYKLHVLPAFWKYLSTPTWRKFVKIMDYITYTNLKHIDEGLKEENGAENKPNHEQSVLQRLAKIDRKIALSMTMDMMIAGVDTTGRTMAAALYFLARYPEKQEKLREEVLKNLPSKDSPVTGDVLINSPYLKAVIKETTRIAPIALGNIRVTIKDMVLSGYRIPKGTLLLSANLYLSNSEAHFKKPKDFKPERWLRTTDEANELSYKSVHPLVHLPFGFGPRSCIGKRLANVELEVALSKIIRNFRLSWPDDKEMKFGSKLLYGIDSPLTIKVDLLEK